MGACFSHGTSWGGREPGGESYFHTLVMREGSLEAERRGASTRRFSSRIDELFLLGLAILVSCDLRTRRGECRGGDSFKHPPTLPLGGEVAGSGDVPDRDRLDVADRDRTV